MSPPCLHNIIMVPAVNRNTTQVPSWFYGYCERVILVFVRQQMRRWILSSSSDANGGVLAIEFKEGLAWVTRVRKHPRVFSVILAADFLFNKLRFLSTYTPRCLAIESIRWNMSSLQHKGTFTSTVFIEPKSLLLRQSYYIRVPFFSPVHHQTHHHKRQTSSKSNELIKQIKMASHAKKRLSTHPTEERRYQPPILRWKQSAWYRTALNFFLNNNWIWSRSSYPPSNPPNANHPCLIKR